MYISRSHTLSALLYHRFSTINNIFGEKKPVAIVHLVFGIRVYKFASDSVSE